MTMNYRKVYGGTKVGDASLCESCAHAHAVQGYSEMEKLTFCNYLYPAVRIPFKVSECTNYLNARLPDFDDMEKIALDLTWVKPSRPAGFKNSFNGKKGLPEKAPQEGKDTDEAA
jgi:hypothetical protein